MKQVLQNLESGAVVVTDVPDPGPSRGRVLVRVGASLLSAGTESAQVAKARQSLLEKIRVGARRHFAMRLMVCAWITKLLTWCCRVKWSSK